MLTGYYQKNKERLWEKAGERCQNLSEEDKHKKQKYDREQYKILLKKKKTKKRQCAHERYRNLPEDKKQRLTEYKKNYSKIQKVKTGWV